MAALHFHDLLLAKNNYFKQIIKPLISSSFNINKLSNLQSEKDSKSQVTERNIIDNIKTVFTHYNVCFEEPSSQQPYDFRNIGPNNSNFVIDYLEIKKTNSNIIYLNNIIPTAGVKYIIFVTSKNNPRMLFLDGSELINGSESWIYEYQHALDKLKGTYVRGQNAANTSGIMQVNANLTYKADISSFT